MSICSGLAAILNAKLLPAIIVEVSYSIVLVKFNKAVSPQRVWDCINPGKSLSFHDRKLNAGLRILAVRCRLTLATAGFLVYLLL